MSTTLHLFSTDCYATMIPIRRILSVYGNIQFKLWNMSKESYVANTTIRIDDIVTVSDAEGVVKTTVPLAKQKKEYRLSSTVPLEDCILYMPYGKDCVIRTK